MDLKRLSATCKFEALLDQALCMQFVVRLNMPKVQSRLMQESTLTFDAAVKIAIAESSAATSCANIDSSFQGGSTEGGTAIHRVFTKRGEQTSRNSKLCLNCGSGTHNPDNCRFKTMSCHKCKMSDTYKSGAMQLPSGEPQI